MNYNSLVQFLIGLENKYPVDEWVVDGVHIWPLARNLIGAVLDNHIAGCWGKDVHVETQLSRQRTIAKKLVLYGKILMQTLLGNFKLSVCDSKHRQRLQFADVVILGDSIGRNVCMPNGELMEHNVDPIRYEFERRGYSVMRFEVINNSLRYPRWGNSYIVDDLIVKVLVKRKIAFFMGKGKKIEYPSFEQMIKECIEVCGNDEYINSRGISGELKFIQYLSEEFLVLLKRIKPCMVLLTCWYSNTKMALTLAAHKLGVPVVDVQHGVAGGSGRHFAYCDWIHIPHGGYELLPDYMWVWNQADYNAIARWGMGAVTPILGGHPMNILWCNPENDILEYYHNKFEREFGREYPFILFSLQPGLNYPDWIVDFINTSHEYTWLIRLHPFVDENERVLLRKLEKRGNIIWESVEVFPLDFLLQHVSVHITSHSSVVIDSAEFSCPSIVLHPLACQLYDSQIKRGIACYAGNREELTVAIEKMLSLRRRNLDFEPIRKKMYAQGQQGMDKMVEIIGMYKC